MGDLDGREAETMAAFRQGFEKAFSDVFNAYFNQLCLFSFNIVGRQAESEDIVIQAFTRLFFRHEDFHNLQAVRAFLYISVRNACFDHLKQYKRLTERQKKYSVLAHNDPDLENAQISGEVMEALYSSMEKLPDGCRLILQLIYIDGLKYQEVADRLQISVGTVKSQRIYGLKKLRAIFPDRELFVLIVLHVASDYLRRR